MKGQVYASRTARRWHRQHRDHRDLWRSAASGLTVIGVLAAGLGIGTIAGRPAHAYPALGVALVGVALLVVASLCWRWSAKTPPASAPRNDVDATVPVNRWRRR